MLFIFSTLGVFPAVECNEKGGKKKIKKKKGKKENNREVSLYNNCSVTACDVSRSGLDAKWRCYANRALPQRTFKGHSHFTTAQN